MAIRRPRARKSLAISIKQNFFAAAAVCPHFRDAAVFQQPFDHRGVLRGPLPYSQNVLFPAFCDAQCHHQYPATKVNAMETLGKPEAKWQKIVDHEDAVVNFDVHKDDFYLITHKDAPRFKIIRTSLEHPDLAHAHTVIPPAEAVITNLSAMADALYVQKLDGGIGKLSRLGYPEGSAQEISLPVSGSIELIGGDPRLQGIFFGLAAWTKASKIYAYVPQSATVLDTKLQPVGVHDDPPDLQSVETKAPSYDGTMIPLSIIFKQESNSMVRTLPC